MAFCVPQFYSKDSKEDKSSLIAFLGRWSVHFHSRALNIHILDSVHSSQKRQEGLSDTIATVIMEKFIRDLVEIRLSAHVKQVI